MKNTLRIFLFTIIISIQALHGLEETKIKENIISEQNQKKDYEKQELSYFMTHIYKTKKFITKPIDYVFGKENSYAKTAFYAALGLVTVTVGIYTIYTYFYGDTLINEIKKEIPFAKEEDSSLQILQENIKNLETCKKEQDLEQYKLIVSERINVQAALTKAQHILQGLGEAFYSGNTQQAVNAHGGMQAYNQKQNDLLSKIGDLNKQRLCLIQQEVDFKNTHPSISVEQFQNIEKQVQDTFNRWGRVIIG